MKKRILLVDDDRDIAQRLQELLSAKYDVSLASNGFDALRLLDADGFEVILLDLRMPGLDGRGFIEEVRRRHNGEAIPVILVSANDDLAREARLLGVADYLAKPFDIEALEALIERRIGG